jgi:hypothetical protein
MISWWNKPLPVAYLVVLLYENLNRRTNWKLYWIVLARITNRGTVWLVLCFRDWWFVWGWWCVLEIDLVVLLYVNYQSLMCFRDWWFVWGWWCVLEIDLVVLLYVNYQSRNLFQRMMICFLTPVVFVGGLFSLVSDCIVSDWRRCFSRECLP